MLDTLPDAIPDDKYWTLGQLVNRRDNICTHLHRLKNQFFTGEEPEAGKLGAGVSQALAERLFSEEILGGLAEGLGIPEETVTAQEETGTDSSDTANADYGQTMTATPGNAAPGAVSPGNAAASYAGKNDNGNNGNGGNGNHYGWGNGNNGNGNNGNGNNGNGNNGNGNGNSGNGNGNSSTGGTNDNNGNASGNTNNTGGSQNQSGILFPVAGEVSELEQELIDMIKTTGKQKNYELVEYVNDVNRDHVEVLMELNINGIMDTAYSYGNERLTNERFTGWTGYYTYDPRGSVTGVTGSDGYIWQSYRYNAFGDITFGKPQYNNVYSYNAENFNPNMDAQYLRARYYSVKTAGFISEDSYLGDITDPLTLNRYNYVKGSPLNYMDPSGHSGLDIFTPPSKYVHTGDIPVANDSNASYDITKKANTEAACSIINSYINDNQGAFMGVTAGVALVVLTAPASAPVLAVIGAGMAGGAVGMVIGGVLEKGISSADIARTLKTKYNIDVTEHQNLDLDSLPSEVKDLCSQYDKNFEDMEGYFETGSVLMGLGVAFHEAGYFLDSLQASIAEKSKKAYESLKSWFNKTFKGESGPGVWEKTNEAMSDASRNYQKFVTGAEDGMVYKVNDVKFDGFKNGILMEAKGNYSQFVNKTTGKFQTWFNGKESLISQANRQLNAANGTKIQWFFNDEVSLNAVKDLFKNEGITDIELILKPMQ